MRALVRLGEALEPGLHALLHGVRTLDAVPERLAAVGQRAIGADHGKRERRPAGRDGTGDARTGRRQARGALRDFDADAQAITLVLAFLLLHGHPATIDGRQRRLLRQVDLGIDALQHALAARGIFEYVPTLYAALGIERLDRRNDLAHRRRERVLALVDEHLMQQRIL